MTVSYKILSSSSSFTCHYLRCCILSLVTEKSVLNHQPTSPGVVPVMQALQTVWGGETDSSNERHLLLSTAFWKKTITWHIRKLLINLYRPSGTTSVSANVLLFGRAVQRLYRCVIPLLNAPSKHKFKTIIFFECLVFFYWLLRLSEIDF
jgi:hypothetical protein